jgi:hypothetical protein
MQLRKLLSCILIGMVLLLVIVPSAHAQTSTSITIVAPPSQAPLQSDGTAQFDVTAQVTITGLPKISAPQVTSSNYDYYLLVVAMGYINEVSQTSPNTSIGGSVSATPDSCLPPGVTGLRPGYTVCIVMPACQFTFVSGCPSISDELTFQATLTNVQAGQYSMRAIAFLVWQTPQAGNNLGVPVDGPQGSSWNTADFYVEVANNPVQEYTTPTTPFASTESNSPPSSNSDNFALIGIGLVAVIVVVGAIIVLNKRRTHQKPADVSHITPTEAPTSTSVVSKPKSESSPPAMETLPIGLPKKATEAVATSQSPTTKMYCNQCGAIISRDSKFCKECGSQVT